MTEHFIIDYLEYGMRCGGAVVPEYRTLSAGDAVPHERLQIRAIVADALDLARLHVDEVHALLPGVKVERHGILQALVQQCVVLTVRGQPPDVVPVREDQPWLLGCKWNEGISANSNDFRQRLNRHAMVARRTTILNNLVVLSGPISQRTILQYSLAITRPVGYRKYINFYGL
jgi:hypothetical protein